MNIRFKEILLTFSLLLLITQLSLAQECPFHVQFRTINATCYNNGKVLYALFKDNGNILDSTAYSETGYYRVRIYYMNDTVKNFHRDYHGGWDTLTIDYGTYTIGVEAWCTGHIAPFDTQVVLKINTDYQTPVAGALGKFAETIDGLGNRPSLACQNTGRLQFKIQGGKLPFTVTMKDTIRHYYDTIIFTERNSGIDIYKWDYKDYFTIDSLAAGNYIIHIEDACGTGMSDFPQKIDTIEFTKLKQINIYASTGNFTDSNVVKIDAVLNQNYKPYFAYLMPKYVQYRFTHDGGLGDGEWKAFPEVSSQIVTLYDTVAGASKYCDIWNKNIRFEYQLTGCGIDTITKKFQIYEPSKRYFSTADTLTEKYHGTDSRGREKFGEDKVRHTHDYKIHYYSNSYDYHDNSKYNNTLINYSEQYVDPSQRFHYTHPLVWKYVDTSTKDTIKRDTISKIVDWSYIYCWDIESYYGSFVDSTLVVNIERILVDGNNCTLVDTTSEMVFRYWYPGCGFHPQEWVLSPDGENTKCGEKRSIKLYGRYLSNVVKDSMKISLVKSPLGNFYNFDAIYNANTSQWDISNKLLFNNSEIEFNPTGITMTMTDFALPKGYYEFNIQYKYHTCGADSFANTTIANTFNFNDSYSVELNNEPIITSEQECSVLKFKYNAGSFKTVRRYTVKSENYEILHKEYTIDSAHFKIIDGPVGGYDDRYFNMGETMQISIPGTYIVCMEPRNYPCDPIYFYDTIVNLGGSVIFDFDLALLCSKDDTKGDVYVQAAEGSTPYSYVLYSGKNKTGVTINTNSTGHFHDVPMTSNQVLSCMVTDACGAYFHVNIYPTTLANVQKIYFDNHSTDTTICEGSSISVHALGTKQFFNYEWTGPNGFHSTSSDSTLYISRGDTSGWYKVTITGTECNAITDSIYLNIKKSPTLSMSLSVTEAVCPCQDVTVSFRPESSDPTADTIHFTIAFVNANGIETRHYKAKSGETVTDIYNSATLARIYPLRIDDGNCDYTIADDTVKIPIRKDIISSCNILTKDTTVCFNDDARLFARANDSIQVPYVLRWYSDYGLTNLLQTDSINIEGAWSQIDTHNIVKHTVLYVAVEKEGKCTTIYGSTSHTINMDNDTTVTLSCGEAWRLYDDGGPNRDHKIDSKGTYRFISEDGGPVALHFNSRRLGAGSSLWFFSGNILDEDSLLIMFDNDDNLYDPGLIVSRSNTLTIYFQSGSVADSGWSAIVERSPGIAIADPWPLNEVGIVLNVCQSQKNTWMDSIGNPYNIVPNIVEFHTTLDNAMRKAGTYYYSDTLVDINGCDSIVNFKLIVDPPMHHDTTVVTTNMHGNSFTWSKNDSTYTQSGKHSITHTTKNGCDSLDILNLIILQIDTSKNEICDDTTTTMGISVSEPDMSWSDSLISSEHKIGDVLFINNGQQVIMDPDTFLNKYPGKLPIGVVFYIDGSGQHGRAVALKDAHNSRCGWAKSGMETEITSLINAYATNKIYKSDPSDKINDGTPILDMNGYGNTMKIKTDAETKGSYSFSDNAPAAYYCYYFDHNTLSTNTDNISQGWYLPAAGELCILFAQRIEINKTLDKLNQHNSNVKKLDDKYWSSTGGRPEDTAWDYQGSGVGLNRNGKSNSTTLRVRAIITF